MRCDDRDQDLLLLAHGELPVLPRWRTHRHLRQCPRCRERQQQFANGSRLLAGVIREQRPLPASPLVAARTAPTPRNTWTRRPALVAVILLMAVLSAMAVVTATAKVFFPELGIFAGSRPQDDGCRPDLPNDHCR